MIPWEPDPMEPFTRQVPRCTSQCGTVRWGLVDANAIDHTNLAGASTAIVDAIIAGLESEDGPFRSGGYYFPNPGDDILLIAWFIVPASYPDLLTALGFKWGPGNVATPTGGNVMTQAQATPLQDVNVLLNGPAGTQDANGWSYTPYDIDGVPHRIYLFEEYRSQLVGQGTGTNNLVLRSRSGGVATVKAPGGNNFAYGSPYSQFSNMGDPTFDEYFVLTTTNGTNVVTYPNAGPDVAEVANATSEWQLWERGPWPLIGNIGSLSLTLFVSA